VHDIFGVFPNLSVRICETKLGRLSWKDLAFVAPTHVICLLSTLLVLTRLLPTSLATSVLEPIGYSDENPFLEDLMREALANAGFCVCLLVLPELCRLNKIPRWACVFLMYPLYNMEVDATGMGSTFAPNALFALSALDGSKFDLGQSWTRILGALCGGLLGGKIMRTFFPDDPKE